MIKEIIKMLNSLDDYESTENIEIAKGKYSIPSSIKEGWDKLKRTVKYKNNGR